MFRRCFIRRCQAAAAAAAAPTPAASAEAAAATASSKSKSVATTKAGPRSELAKWQENHLARIGRTLNEVLREDDDADSLSALTVVSTLKHPIVAVPRPKRFTAAEETSAEPPPRTPTPRWVLNLAAEHHSGLAVYRSRKDVIAVLQAVRVSKPEWWDASCDDILARMLALGPRRDITSKKGAIITIDGLDAVGKSTVTRALASEDNNVSKTTFSDKKLLDKRQRKQQQKQQAEQEGQSSSDAEQSKKESESSSSASSSSSSSLEQEMTTRIPGAVLIRTPAPEFEAARSRFRSLEDPIARAFYSACNYIAADDVIRNAQHHVVVLDRWWCSTAAMGLAIRSKHLMGLDAESLAAGASNYRRGGGDAFHGVLNAERQSRDAEELQQMLAFLPEEGAEVYEWPTDLPHVDLRLLLDCSEETRLARMEKRGDENAEERELRRKAALRSTAREAYMRMFPPLETVMVPNYAVAVNTIIDMCEQRGIVDRLFPDGRPVRFDDEFVASVKPW